MSDDCGRPGYRVRQGCCCRSRDRVANRKPTWLALRKDRRSVRTPLGDWQADIVNRSGNPPHSSQLQNQQLTHQVVSRPEAIHLVAATPPDPFQPPDRVRLSGVRSQVLYNLFFVFQPRWYKLQSGLARHLAGGWTIAPVFTAGSGSPITVGTINGGGSAFGEAGSINLFGYGNSENAIPMVPFHGNASRHDNVLGDSATGVGTGGFGVNLFANPLAAWNSFRQPILGYDTRDGGWGVLRGLPYWNLDLSVKKTFQITERFALEAQVVFTNVLNHDQFGDPTGDFISTGDPASWGVLPGSVTNGSRTYQRQMQFGIRLSF